MESKTGLPTTSKHQASPPRCDKTLPGARQQQFEQIERQTFRACPCRYDAINHVTLCPAIPPMWKIDDILWLPWPHPSHTELGSVKTVRTSNCEHTFDEKNAQWKVTRREKCAEKSQQMRHRTRKYPWAEDEHRVNLDIRIVDGKLMVDKCDLWGAVVMLMWAWFFSWLGYLTPS